MQMLPSGQNNQQQGYPQQGRWQGQGGYNQPPQGQWQQPPNTSPQGYPQGEQGQWGNQPQQPPQNGFTGDIPNEFVRNNHETVY